MVEKALDPGCIEALGLQQVKHHAGIELAGPGAHGQAVDGGEAHRAVLAAAALQRAHGGARAQMAGHDPTRRQRRVDLAQAARDVLVGQPVEAIAAHARLVPAVGDGEAVRDLGVRAVKGRVEAGHLGDVRVAAANLPDRGQIVGLMQRGQRDKTVEIGQDGIVHPHRGRIVGTAMDHPMPDRQWPDAAQASHQPIVELPQSRRAVLDLGRLEPRVDQARTRGVDGRQMRPGADAFELTLEGEFQPGPGRDMEQLELDARRAGIDDQERALHRHHSAATAAAVRRAWA